jgi:hypothetical protein
MPDSERIDYIVWPLKRGDTLSNHDWFPFFGHRFLASKFVALAVMEGRRADLGTAVILWSEAMRQDPAGTLPDCDIELATLARFGSVGEWQAERVGVMRGWVSVSVEDDRTGEVTTRLGHPGFLQGIVEEMFKRKRGRDGAREAARLATRKSRIRKKMADLNIEENIIKDDRVIHVLAEFFESSDLYMTPDNLRIAMTECIGYTGEVAHFPQSKRGRDR